MTVPMDGLSVGELVGRHLGRGTAFGSHGMSTELVPAGETG